MGDVWSVEFTLKAELAFFSLWTIKGRTPCFSTKKNAVRVIL